MGRCILMPERLVITLRGSSLVAVRKMGTSWMLEHGERCLDMREDWTDAAGLAEHQPSIHFLENVLFYIYI